jgi:hypothetical protein
MVPHFDKFLIRCLALAPRPGRCRKKLMIEINLRQVKKCQAPIYPISKSKGSLVISVVEAVCGGNFRAKPENYPHIYYPPQ